MKSATQSKGRDTLTDEICLKRKEKMDAGNRHKDRERRK
jgi:hypothetical protein